MNTSTSSLSARRHATRPSSQNSFAKRTTNKGLVVSLLGIFVALTLISAGCGSASDRALRGAVRKPEPNVGELSLTRAVSHEPFEFKAKPGEINLVYFGYTYCPDVCPTTLSELRKARNSLGRTQQRVRVIMVTIDPARDHDGNFDDYVKRFFPDGIALRTDDQTKLHEVTKAFGATYEVKPGPKPDAPDVAHSASVYAVDANAVMRVQWTYGTPDKDMAHDLRVLVNDAQDLAKQQPKK